MNRNQLKASVAAFLDELFEIRPPAHSLDGWSVYTGGKYSGQYTNEQVARDRVNRLKQSIGKVFRKHLKAAIVGQTAADGATPVSQKEGV